jgi:hypothetical protein
MEGNFRDKDKHNNVCTNMPVGALLMIGFIATIAGMLLYQLLHI